MSDVRIEINVKPKDHVHIEINIGIKALADSSGFKELAEMLHDEMLSAEKLRS